MEENDSQGLQAPLYCIVGARPVKALNTDDGGLGVYAYNWDSGAFELAMDYLERIYFGSQDEVEQVTREEFDLYVEELRTKIKN